MQRYNTWRARSAAIGVMITSTAAIASAVRAHAQVVINEIMHSPAAPEPEWIELFNPGTAAVDLDGWSVLDAAGNRAAIQARSIAAGGYLVLTRDSTALKRERAVGSPIVELALPSLNNSGDAVRLHDANAGPVDSVAYSAAWGGGDGRSLERRAYNYPAARDSTWETSSARGGATPGKRNAVTPALLDISIGAVRFDAAVSAVTVVVGNNGGRATIPAEAILYLDADDDGAGSGGEELARTAVQPIAARGSATIVIAWPRPLTSRGEPGIVELRMAGDERPADNIATFAAVAAAADTSVVISEIMFDPVDIGGHAGAEYVELYNRTGRALDPAGWKLYDGTLKPQATIPTTTPAITPGGYLVIACDSSIYSRFPVLRDSANVVVIGKSSFSLNADQDDLALRSAAGALLDEVPYAGNWHRKELGEMKGIALERISMSGGSADRRNWSSSAAPLGGTPGARNSLDIPPAAAGATITITPPIFSPDADGREDFARVSCRFPSQTARIEAIAYDRGGRAVRRLASNELVPARSELVWDGRDDQGRPLEPGIYIVRVEAYDDGGMGSFSAQATVVIARKF